MSSRDMALRGNANNEYRQLHGVSVLADNALAAALNVVVKLFGASQRGGVLQKYRIALRLQQAARSAQAAATSALAAQAAAAATPAAAAPAAAPAVAPAAAVAQLAEAAARSGGFCVRVGFGLHIGWAIEGAIGSAYKIDASYLSPAVNVAARIESATRFYGVDVLMSRAFAQCLSFEAVSLLRLIDRVRLKGVAEPIDLYTFDWDAGAALQLLRRAENSAAAAAVSARAQAQLCVSLRDAASGGTASARGTDSADEDQIVEVADAAGMGAGAGARARAAGPPPIALRRSLTSGSEPDGAAGGDASFRAAGADLGVSSVGGAPPVPRAPAGVRYVRPVADAQEARRVRYSAGSVVGACGRPNESGAPRSGAALSSMYGTIAETGRSDGDGDADSSLGTAESVRGFEGDGSGVARAPPPANAFGSDAAAAAAAAAAAVAAALAALPLRYTTPADMLADMAALQPESAFPAEFILASELAVESYLGDPENGVSANWALARASALRALRVRPSDAPLAALVRLLEATGQRDAAGDLVAPRAWPGFRVA